MNITSYKNLTVWQKSIELVLQVYSFTKTFPSIEEYGLKSQMRRSAVSVPSNIAEGRSRSTRKEFCQFLYIALGSASELQTQIEIAYKIGYINNASYSELDGKSQEVAKMLHSCISALQKPISKSQ